MKNIFPFFSIVFSLLVFVITPTNASAVTSVLSKGFGGKIYTAPIPGITCNGLGKLMILSSNANSLLGSIGTRQVKKSEAQNLAKSIYGAIPTYATNTQKLPIQGKQILGKENGIPDLKTCYIPTPGGPVYIPVLKTTNNYNVSR